MMYDLIEVTPKKNWKKIIIVSVVVLVVILFLAIVIIKNKKFFKEDISKNIVNSVEDIQSSGIVTEEEKTKHIAKVNMYPVYTQEGKDLVKNIYNSEEKVVYLTFDDGPSKTVTPLILDLLKQENIKATFFVLGSRAELNPEIIKREYLEGHYIANHGYSHIYGNIYETARISPRGI